MSGNERTADDLFYSTAQMNYHRMRWTWFGYESCNDKIQSDLERAEKLAERIRIYREFVARKVKPDLEFSPLKRLVRSLNGLWLRLRIIRQPCWGSGRWRSLT